MTDLARLRSVLDVDIPDDLLTQALMHRSYAYENGNLPTNERLEFLGDAVLGIVVTQTLFDRFPDSSEGQLAKLRAAVVNATALAEVARSIDLGDHLFLGRGEEGSGGRDKSSILADTMEAVFAAAFLARGPDAAAGLIHRLLDPRIEQAADLGAGLDWKTSLQEAAAAHDRGVPEYRVTDAGPDHAKEFHAEAVLDGVVAGTGTGPSKKVAEQRAAQAAYESLLGSGPAEG
jgi:ribonuclease-3